MFGGLPLIRAGLVTILLTGLGVGVVFAGLVVSLILNFMLVEQLWVCTIWGFTPHEIIVLFGLMIDFLLWLYGVFCGGGYCAI